MAAVAPEVINIEFTPQGPKDVSLDPTIYVFFNTDIAHRTVVNENIKILTKEDKEVPLELKYNSLNRMIEIKPTVRLTSLTEYTLFIQGDDVIAGTTVDGITNILGRPMIGNYTLSFTTEYVEDDSSEEEPPLDLPDEEEPIDIGDLPVFEGITFDVAAIYPGVNAYNVSSGKIAIKFNKNIDPKSVNDQNIYIIERDNL